jgi:hypothetical protein
LPVILLVVGSTAWAQDVPYTGTIVEDDVAVRAGAGRTFYIVGKLNKGDTVTVDQVIFTWCRILPPKGVYSYISKAFVDVKGSGNIGVVNQDGRPVKAASVNGPGESYRRHFELNKGDTVTIVGEDGSFYKIVPPTSAHVYVPASAVKLLENGAAAAAAPAPPAGSEATPMTPVTSTAVSTPAVTEAPVETPRATVTITPPPVPAPAPAPTPATDVTPVQSPAATVTVATPVPPAPPAPVQTPAPAPAPAPATTVTVTPPAAPAATATVTPPPAPTTVTVTTPQPMTPVDAPAAAPSASVTTSTTTTTSTFTQQLTPGVAPTTTTTVTSHETIGGPAPRPPSHGLQPFDRAVVAAEARFDQVYAMPLEQRPLQELLTTYETLNRDSGLGPVDRRIVSFRISQIRRDVTLASAVKDIKGARETASTKVDIEAERRAAQFARGQYDVVGTLMASGVYDGDNLPRLYRVVDPVEMRTIAYLQTKPGVDVTMALGRVVGVQGRTRYNPALKLRLIEVERFDVLERLDR